MNEVHLSWLALGETVVLAGMIVGCIWLAAMSPPKEQGVCWACGQPGEKLYWHALDEGRTGPYCNQRVSYLIHPACVWLAEKQAGF